MSLPLCSTAVSRLPPRLACRYAGQLVVKGEQTFEEILKVI